MPVAKAVELNIRALEKLKERIARLPHERILECHLRPDNFAFFSCIDCHEHRKSEMDNKHDEVPGYVWESEACLSCHPDGRE